MNEYFILNKKNSTLIAIDNDTELVIAGLFSPDTYPRSSPATTPNVEKDNCTRMDQ